MISLFAHPNSHPYDSDIIIADKNGKVNGWICKNVDIKYDYKNLVNAGIYVINKKIVDYIISFQNKSGRETVDFREVYTYDYGFFQVLQKKKSLSQLPIDLLLQSQDISTH